MRHPMPSCITGALVSFKGADDRSGRCSFFRQRMTVAACDDIFSRSRVQGSVRRALKHIYSKQPAVCLSEVRMHRKPNGELDAAQTILQLAISLLGSPHCSRSRLNALEVASNVVRKAST